MGEGALEKQKTFPKAWTCANIVREGLTCNGPTLQLRVRAAKCLRRNRLRGGDSTHRSNFTLICYLLVMSCYLLHSSQMIPICSRLRLYLSTASLYGSHLALNKCSVEICPLGRFNPGRNLTPADKLFHSVHYWQSIRLCPDATWLSGTHKYPHTCAPHVIPHRQVYKFNVICDGYPLSLSPFSHR